ncbi:MAG: SAM-dependent methyltransferase [Cereibacter sphaeroides]|uniref:SAM-dependent methyltransferase n=1 Tax=Cereibacter sphaeroides TaxID=1063 RepID=A0A2W5S2J6_CERSP|nr:MAG: SAM-dependent methyltransferase [Cereibacter sphaeroides]
MWEKLLDRLASGVLQEGNLTLHLPDGTSRHYGDGNGPAVELTIHDPGLIRRLVRNPDLALGEGYMDGAYTIRDDDIAGLLQVLLVNVGKGRAKGWRYPFRQVQRLLGRIDQIAPAHKSRQNVAHHYDLSGDLYRLFLDTDQQYSCAYFKTPEDTLEQAQIQKKAHIAGKLLLKPGMRVLDIGCGWGGMALTLARDYGAKVLGVTLSEEQHAVANRRVTEAGLQDQIEIRLQDYRAVTGTFDRIVSVGMFEHVGVPHYSEYFDKVSELLAPDGVALIHTIGRVSPPGRTSPWISKYIFPGGYIPGLSEITPVLEKIGLYTTDIEVWRLHYAETLLHWRRRFEANLDKVRALYDDRFCRMWRYYLAASEMTFRHDNQCVFHIQLAHDQKAVPLTRDYLYRGNEAA